MKQHARVPTHAEAALLWQAFTGTAGGPRYAFGTNEHATSLARACRLDGVIDDYYPNTRWNDLPVLRLKDVPLDALVISCVAASHATTALNRLAAAGISRHADYMAVADMSDGQLPQIPAVAEMRLDHATHADEYAWLRGRLCDDISRHILDQLLGFRLGADLSCMTEFEYAVERQYFEDFLGLQPGTVFVDGGGFDGATSLEFAKRYPDYGKIHVFEPTPEMLLVAQGKLASLPHVAFHPIGLYDRAAQLRFDAGSGSASRISEGGSMIIDVDRLDAAITDRVDFIKLDLEGAERNALAGARDHILADHPALAVAVYHRAEDFRIIPRSVLGVRDDYHVHLRHYTEGWSETVMFFIPALH